MATVSGQAVVEGNRVDLSINTAAYQLTDEARLRLKADWVIRMYDSYLDEYIEGYFTDFKLRSLIAQLSELVQDEAHREPHRKPGLPPLFGAPWERER